MAGFGLDVVLVLLLAAGFIDLVVEAGLGFYDIAALVPLIENAGGVVSDWDGGARPTEGGQAIALRGATRRHYSSAGVGRVRFVIAWYDQHGMLPQ